MLGSYNNRIHNFELTLISLVTCTYFDFCKLFSHITKLKNVKRVKIPKRKIKGLERKKIKKNMKNEPQTKKR